MEMIIIYDFDGTLTPTTLPQYQILTNCGYSNREIAERASIYEEKYKLDLYSAYWKAYREALSESGFIMNKENICLGAKDIVFNEGVLEYFEKFQSSKTGVKHYIVTSGIKYYIENTLINKFIDGVYGVTFKEKDGIFDAIDVLVSDKEKVNIIKNIQQENDNINDILYFGDGFTDRFAFEYVHKIGGISVFISTNEKYKDSYYQLENDKIIDKSFSPKFGEGSEIYKFIEELVKKYEFNYKIKLGEN